MVFVASEMQRRGMKLPLLIGGATTSRTHTAVKIAPAYKGPTHYVTDASRAVPVVQKLLGDERDNADRGNQGRSGRRARELSRRPGQAPAPAARAKRASARRSSKFAPVQAELPRRARRSRIIRSRSWLPYIDWTPFFASWDLVGRYPAILDDAIVGEAARNLYNDAHAMLEQLVAEKWVRANGVVGFWPANRDGDDIVLWQNEKRASERARLLHAAPADGQGRRQSSEFRAGGFRRAAGGGSRRLYRRFRGDGRHRRGRGRAPLQARQRRLLRHPGASAVRSLGRSVRRSAAREGAARALGLCGGGNARHTTNCSPEKYRGIRPAPGYPAQPDHTEKRTLFDLLEARERTGMDLTESLAMTPPSSVSGLYFAHPRAEYFGVGRIDRDQVEDYARRKGWDAGDGRTLALADLGVWSLMQNAKASFLRPSASFSPRRICLTSPRLLSTLASVSTPAEGGCIMTDIVAAAFRRAADARLL